MRCGLTSDVSGVQGALAPAESFQALHRLARAVHSLRLAAGSCWPAGIAARQSLRALRLIVDAYGSARMVDVLFPGASHMETQSTCKHKLFVVCGEPLSLPAIRRRRRPHRLTLVPFTPVCTSCS